MNKGDKVPSRGLFSVHLCSHEQDTHRIISSKSVFILCFYRLCVFILRFEKETRGGRVNCRVAVKLCKCLAKAGTQRGHGTHGAAKEKKRKKRCAPLQNQSPSSPCSNIILQPVPKVERRFKWARQRSQMEGKKEIAHVHRRLFYKKSTFLYKP